MLAFNLSNRYLDLDPVIGRQAADAGMACRIAYDIAISPEEKQAGKQPSIWAVVAETEDDLGELASTPRWRTAATPALPPGRMIILTSRATSAGCRGNGGASRRRNP